MNPDDPRHGTNAGYVAGCRCDQCRDATNRYHKRLVLDHDRGFRRRLPALGTHRRIQALVRVGWTLPQVGAAMGGVSGEAVRQVLISQQVQRDTAARARDAFALLAMKLPPERNRVERLNAARSRNRGLRNGWPPPLAWDDIDNPLEAPDMGASVISPTDVDRVVVERILAGEWRLPANRAERAVVIQSAAERGVPLNELERRTGWNVWRIRKEAS